MDASTATLILTAITALGALGAAWGAWKSAEATKLASEARLFSDLFSEYGQPEMLRSLRVLRNWKSNNGDEFEVKWKKALDSGDETAHDVDRARRHVKFYFLSVLRLYEARYCSEQFLREVCAVDGVNVLYDIVERLEYALNPAYDRSKFDTLRKICGRAGTRDLIAPVPAGPVGKGSGAQ